ncbi:MAG TPA: AAA family ATPase [bacterium]|nr:AAA family ATPase [bacterium]
MSAVTCPRCGRPNPADARFCSHCGSALDRSCPECGAPVDPAARFCASCGIRLRGAAPIPAAPVITAETRKVVTVLFADLVGSTGLTERLDPEEAREVIGKFYTVVQGVVEGWYEGTVANYLGDAVLAVFGLPATHEDDPERAVRAGLAIQQAIPVLNTHLAASHGVQVAVRVGIDTGEVVAATGSTFERDFLVSDTVTTAARLQQSVPPGGVVVGERTYRLTNSSIEYRELPPLQVKGKSGAVRVWAAVAALPERGEIRRITAPLIGRQGELAILRSLYRRSRDEGRAHLVTIIGDPGVGKSRLLREFLAEIRETVPRPLVLRGRSVAFGGRIGFHALLDILRAQGGLMDTDPPETVRAKVAGWLAEALPDGRDLLDDLLLTFGSASDGDPQMVRRRLFEAWGRLLAGCAARGPVVLAFEDAHWADDAVLDLIVALAEQAAALPLFLVCLARPELLERRPGWGGGRRNASTLELAPLSEAEAEQLAQALASQGLSAEAVKRIAQRAEGNALFVEELVRMMSEGSLPGASIPDTVQAVITARIDRLPPVERLTLQAAAVVGRTFWPSAVSGIAGLTPEQTATALEALVQRELVLRRPGSSIASEPEYAFRHILTRDVAYGLLPRAQRQRAHAETVRWFESRLGERLEEVVEIMAEHLRVAGDERAGAFLHRAGLKARRLYANADAVRLLTQALEATEDEALRSAIHRDRGDVHQLVGAYDAALEDYTAGLHAAQRAGDRALMAALQNKIGLIHHRRMMLDDAEQAFREAARLAREAGDRAALGQTLIDLANIGWDRGRMGPDHPDLREGLALVRAGGDPAALARALNLLCMVNVGAGLGEEAIAAAEEGLAVARAAGDRSREATSLSYLCVINGFLGRYRTALPHGEEALRIAEAIGDRRRAAYTYFFLGRIQTAFGRWTEAAANLARAREMVQGIARIQFPWLFYFSALACDLLGELEQAKAMWRASATVESHSPAWRQISLLAAVDLARAEDDAPALRAALDELAALPGGVFVPSDVEAVLHVGEAFLDSDRLDDLTNYLAARRPGIERFASGHGLASLAMLDARLAARRGDTARLRPLLDQALAQARQTEDVTRTWRVLELRAELLGAAEAPALRTFLEQIAAGLTEGTRRTFLDSRRVRRGLSIWR